MPTNEAGNPVQEEDIDDDHRRNELVRAMRSFLRRYHSKTAADKEYNAHENRRPEQQRAAAVFST